MNRADSRKPAGMPLLAAGNDASAERQRDGRIYRAFLGQLPDSGSVWFGKEHSARFWDRFERVID